MSISKVNTSKFKHNVWENDWYECPECSFDSLDYGWNHCPSCGEVLSWED